MPGKMSKRRLVEGISLLTERIVNRRRDYVEPYIHRQLVKMVEKLQESIPGLDFPPDAKAAGEFLEQADYSYTRGLARDALVCALWGIQVAPHDSRFFYYAALACRDLGDTDLAITFLAHATWINPGFTDAQIEHARLVNSDGGINREDAE